MSRLSQPIYFVRHSLAAWPELNAEDDWVSPDRFPHRFIAPDTWSVQTYLRLRERGHDVRLSTRFVPEAINVAHYDDVSIREHPYRSYIVAISVDRPWAMLGHQRIVQNRRQVRDGRDHLVTHWPQPGLRPRSPQRGTRVERIGYIGRYQPEHFIADSFRRRLESMGVELVVRTQADWHDFRDLDLVLSARSMAAHYLARKPASKLVNAWWAECPALLTTEPAFEDMRETDLDFITIDGADDVIDAIQRLRDEPARYGAMVENGRRRRGRYSVDAVSAEWEQILAGPVTAGYERWRSGAMPMRRVRQIGRFAVRAAQHKLTRWRWHAMSHAGAQPS